MRFGAFLLPASAAKHDELKSEQYPGANPTYYQRSLNEHARVIKQLEDLGFDFVAFSEHHFHLEGLEISNNPILLGAWAAGFTNRIRIGQMATVLPARNPILVAEDLAMLEQQQRNLLRCPDRRLLKLNIDAGGVRSRLMIERAIAQENAAPAPLQAAAG